MPDTVHRPLRLWPAALLVVLMWATILAVRQFAPATMAQFMLTFWSPLVATLLIFVWWLFLARVPRWRDRLLAIGVFVAAAAAVFPLTHSTVRGFGLALFGLRVVITVWVVWLLATRAMSWPVRRNGLIALIALAWASFTLVQIEGVDGTFAATFHWRWKATPEEEFLAGLKAPSSAPTTAPALTASPGDWPEFRGPRRDGRLAGVRIETDWAKNPPKQIWRHRIGPGWGSMSIVGDRLFTQEQRGPDEAVVCYHADTGEQLWAHADAARFTESIAGPGPRATPTFHDGKLYTLGAAGRLNCLDAASGRVIWSRDAAADSRAKVPMWGFAASPLVADGLVTVYTGGPDNKAVTAYRAATGEVAWSAGKGRVGYSSTHLATLSGVRQILIAAGDGLTSLEPESGAVLWTHDWPLPENMARITQPTILSDTDVLLGTGFDFGARRLHVTRDASGKWEVTPGYTSRALKPYFNDLVSHDGHLYGFDGVFLACVDAATGKSKWRTRGYGSGQVLLLTDQSVLLVVSETGEVALVDAAPDAYRERAKFQAIEGKTWNHPVVARGKLYVRNGEEIAAYALPTPAAR